LDNAPLPPLTEDRVRTVSREYAGLHSIFHLFRMMWGLIGQSGQAKWAARAQRVEELVGTDRNRVVSILRLIGLIGVEEARAQAGALSSRAAIERNAIRGQPWKYSIWDHTLLIAVAGNRLGAVPILPEEVDAVARVLDEICRREWDLRSTYKHARNQGELLRADPGTRTRPAGSRPRHMEARKWLSRKRRPSMLASNRFGSADEGLEFVEELYAAGAKAVLIPGDAVDPDDGAGFAHVDVLVVRLPGDLQARAQVLAITNREARHEGLDEQQDEGQAEVRLWWD
jgi:hypothetical protein